MVSVVHVMHRLRKHLKSRMGWVAACCLWFALQGVSVSAAEVHVVRRNETLYGIARKYGVTVAQLAEQNGLSKNAWVYVGQRLVIPGSSKEKSPTVLPANVQKAIDTASVRKGRWKYLVVHHSGVDQGTVAGMDRYHREERHMEHGLAYHFVIGNGHGMKDGEIAVGERWRRQLNGGHLASSTQNTYSIGICLVGNFDKTKPTAAQLRSLSALCKALMKRCDLSASAVKTHREINVVGTRCPGRNFPKSFLK